jgi:hypothetical protein
MHQKEAEALGKSFERGLTQAGKSFETGAAAFGERAALIAASAFVVAASIGASAFVVAASIGAITAVAIHGTPTPTPTTIVGSTATTLALAVVFSTAVPLSFCVIKAVWNNMQRDKIGLPPTAEGQQTTAPVFEPPVGIEHPDNRAKAIQCIMS